jgi:hypothetical protein
MKHVIIKCSKCGLEINMLERSHKRYMKTHNTGEYVCLACINKVSSSNRRMSDEERAKRSTTAKQLWEDPEYRRRVNEAIQQATSTDDFKQKASVTNKERWKDPKFRKMMEDKARETWEKRKAIPSPEEQPGQ